MKTALLSFDRWLVGIVDGLAQEIQGRYRVVYPAMMLVSGVIAVGISFAATWQAMAGWPAARALAAAAFAGLAAFAYRPVRRLYWCSWKAWTPKEVLHHTLMAEFNRSQAVKLRLFLVGATVLVMAGTALGASAFGFSELVRVLSGTFLTMAPVVSLHYLLCSYPLPLPPGREESLEPRAATGDGLRAVPHGGR